MSGTFHLLQAVREHWEQLPDEVFGSLGETGRFSETTPYDPRSPYSASKHVVLTNCSNNDGPWQFAEKLIPVAILKVAAAPERN